jgi:hypothetical protein
MQFWRLCLRYVANGGRASDVAFPGKAWKRDTDGIFVLREGWKRATAIYQFTLRLLDFYRPNTYALKGDICYFSNIL